MKKLLIIAALALASFGANAQKIQCTATTQAKEQCSRKAVEGQQHCTQHNPNAIKCGAPTKAGTPCKRTVKTAGAHCKPHS